MKRKQAAFFADHLSQIFLHFASTYEISSVHRVSSSPQMQLAAYVKSSTLYVRTCGHT